MLELFSVGEYPMLNACGELLCDTEHIIHDLLEVVLVLEKLLCTSIEECECKLCVECVWDVQFL